MESYRTVKQETSAEFIEKRSKFIGYIKPVQTEEEAIAFIQSIKSKHWDATHNVYAYSLREGQTRRYSDDGEPQGTAGIPTLDVLQKADITDAVVVVTRYFGGILLGGGGLVIASLIPECVGVIDDTVFEDTVHIKFHMAHEDFQAFEKRLADTTCGAVKAVVTGKEFFAVSET